MLRADRQHVSAGRTWLAARSPAASPPPAQRCAGARHLWHHIPALQQLLLLLLTLSLIAQVLDWAQQEFRREVAWSKADAQVHLAKACLLIALEEEAAVELNQDLPHSG